MASKDPQPRTDTIAPETGQLHHTLEELRESRGITTAAFCGVCAQEGWRPGRSVTATEFDAAVKRFMKGGGGSAARR